MAIRLSVLRASRPAPKWSSLDNPRMGRSHAVAIACHWSLWKGMIALGKRGAAK
jgi:hypothetical protein